MDEFIALVKPGPGEIDKTKSTDRTLWSVRARHIFGETWAGSCPLCLARDPWYANLCRKRKPHQFTVLVLVNYRMLITVPNNL